MYEVKIDDGKIWVGNTPITTAKPIPKDYTPIQDLMDLAYQTTQNSLNILGISTTNMSANLPRYSTSENALQQCLEYAQATYGADVRTQKLRELDFRGCDGFYSRDERACGWPCSITDHFMDKDGLTPLYKDLVLWADIVLIASPIRWGNASALYYKMVERLNAIQNQITLHNKVLIKNKVASFIITGGQDNIQSISGQMMSFFTKLGFNIPPFSFFGWSRGWMNE